MKKVKKICCHLHVNEKAPLTTRVKKKQGNNNNNNNNNNNKCEKKDKYLDLARELKKLWNMQVTIIPIVIGAFGTVTKGLLKGLEDLEVGGRVETIQNTKKSPGGYQIKTIRTLGEKETYKYLGILETDAITQEEMKEKLRKNISGELENYSKQNCLKETLSKE